MFRAVSGLYFVEACASPWPRPPKLKGIKAEGKRFERKVAKQLFQGLYGPWFRFKDDFGERYCQPDLILFCGGDLVICEIKLTYTPMARDQLELMYIPIVEKVSGLKARGVILAKNTLPGAPKAYFSFDQGMQEECIPFIQWLGNGRLAPPKGSSAFPPEISLQLLPQSSAI